MDYSDIKASIIVPTYGRPESLHRALLSLAEQDYPKHLFEIIVVDNKPGDDARNIVQELTNCTDLNLVYIEEAKTGLHNARHKGAISAKSDILIFVDDDIEAFPSWLSGMIDAFHDLNTAIVAGRILPEWENEPPQWLHQLPLGYLSLLDYGEQKRDLKWPETAYGCNMGIRRSILYKLGGFNPDAIGDSSLIWFRGDGETGLQEKAYRNGCKIVYEPKACLKHVISSSRQNMKYFCWRAFIQGISDSYSHSREKPSRFLGLLHSFRCLVNSLIAYFRYNLSLTTKPIEKAKAFYWWGRGMHKIRAFFSRNLRSHILKKTYLEIRQ